MKKSNFLYRSLKFKINISNYFQFMIKQAQVIINMETEITLVATAWNIGHAYLVEVHPIHTAESMLMMFAVLSQSMLSPLVFFPLHPTQDVAKKVKTRAVMGKQIWLNGHGM